MISLDKGQMTRQAKEIIKAQLEFFKKSVSIKDANVLHHIYTTYLRCLLIYHITPLLGSGVVKPNCIRQFETFCLRKLFRLPNDLKSDVIRNLNTHYQRPTLEVIQELADRVMIKVTKQPKIESFTSHEEKQHKTTKRRDRPLYIERKVLDLMMAVTQRRTVIYYNHRHHCKIHDAIVNEQHMRECEALQICGDITRFNDKLEKNEFAALSDALKREIIATFKLLQLTLTALESKGLYQVSELPPKPKIYGVTKAKRCTG